jgi:hypothetical protein
MVTIICTSYRGPSQAMLLALSFINQTYQKWVLHFMNDGSDPSTREAVESLKDDRIRYHESETVNGYWGHPNREWGLAFVDTPYMMWTNHDNYYVPTFLQEMLDKLESDDSDFVYCDMVHSHQKYNILRTWPAVGGVDMGAFIVKSKIAKKIGFPYRDFCADGRFVEDVVSSGAKISKVEKFLFVHN